MSIVEVAKVAGVSKSTVSRVINHIPGVAEELRAKVIEAMEELDYRPSSRRPGPKPISRRGVRTGNVVLLVAGYETSEVYRMPIFPSILHGAEVALAEAGLNLVVAGLRADGVLPAALNGDQSDGVLIIGSLSELPENVHRRLADLPTIVLLRTPEQLPGEYDRVQYNNRAIGPIAADYLLSKGHTHSAYFNGDITHAAFIERGKVFTNAMETAGAKVTQLALDLSKGGLQNQIDGMVKRLAQTQPAVTSLFASSDHILPYLYRSLNEHGINPGHDLEIVSCDNDETVLKTIDPRPATIDIKPEFIGRLAIRQLRWRLAFPDEDGPMSVVVEPKLVSPH